jgi:hypothetical protein
MRAMKLFSFALSLRLAGGLAAIACLSGSVVVSCSGDPMSGNGGGGGGGSNAPDSASMGRWTPATQDTCTKAFHDTFFVVGPDGKKYPTWHRPEETDTTTNTRCSFGHDHGSDPRGSGMWNDLQSHFAFDVNHDGNIDSTELATAGIPFGLTSELLINSTTPRLEDHTAYKIAFANDQTRTIASGGTGQNLDVRCHVFAAYNQPTSTEDSFASNMFSVIYAVNCNNGNAVAQYPVKVITSTMALYRVPNSFTIDTSGNQQSFGSADPPTSPDGGNELGRRIPISDNVFADVFVTATQTSDFSVLFDQWETQLRLVRSDNTELATLNPKFRVDDPARYFNNGLARSVDLCYSGLNAAGALVTDPLQAGTIVRQVRGSADCSAIAPNGPATPTNQRVSFDKPTSPFLGCKRVAFFGADVVRNPGGATLWYTDAFCANARTTSFTNSIKQFVSSANTPSIVVTDAQAGQQFCQATTVHVPN